MKYLFKWFCYVFIFYGIIGCNKNPTAPEYQKEISVFGYLWGEQPLSEEHAIFISYTKPITDFYDPAQAAITEAVVTIREESSGQIFKLYNAGVKPGYYFNSSLTIRPKASYNLKVEVDGKIVTAVTRVPSILKFSTDLHLDSINYIYPNKDEEVKPIFIESENEDQIIYVDMFCNVESYLNAEYIKPFNEKHRFPTSEEQYGGGKNRPPRHIWIFTRYKDFIAPQYQEQHVIFWYTSMMVFYGSNTMNIFAIDDNYHKFLYSEHPELNGGIYGGIGVFGSLYGQSFEFMVVK